MSFPNLTIQKDPPKNGRRAGIAKGRQFTVTLLGYLCADSMWDLGRGKTKRPVWIAYTGADQACRAFTANFRGGRKAKASGDRFEIPKSAPHRWSVERQGETAVTVAYLPEIFELEPAVHPNSVAFAFMPPRWWLDQQAETLRGEFSTDSLDVARAALFAAFLDRRSPLPIVHDLRFQLELYRAALEEPWTRTPPAYSHEGLDACGLDSPLFCHVSHKTFEEFLKGRANTFFAEEIRHGKNRFRPDCRLLPYPSRAPQQLQLDFAMA